AADGAAGGPPRSDRVRQGGDQSVTRPARARRDPAGRLWQDLRVRLCGPRRRDARNAADLRRADRPWRAPRRLRDRRCPHGADDSHRPPSRPPGCGGPRRGQPLTLRRTGTTRRGDSPPTVEPSYSVLLTSLWAHGLLRELERPSNRTDSWVFALLLLACLMLQTGRPKFR